MRRRGWQFERENGERECERERAINTKGESNTERKARVFVGAKGCHSVTWKGAALSKKYYAHSTSKL